MYKQRIISYYNNFLKTDFDENLTDLVVSSFSFKCINNCRSMLLNGENIFNKIYDDLWNTLEGIERIDVHIMINGNWTEFFENYENYYSILSTFLIENRYVSGINIVIDEDIATDQISDLIFRIKDDFEYMEISFSIDSKSNNLFNYDKFLSQVENRLIDWVSVLFIEEFSYEKFELCSKYDKIVIGIDGVTFKEKFYDFIMTLEKIAKNHIVNGVAIWDYSSDDVKLGKIVSNIIKDDTIIDQKLALVDFYGKSLGGMMNEIFWNIVEDVNIYLGFKMLKVD